MKTGSINQEEKLKEETVKLLFVDKFSGLAANQEHYGKTDVLKVIINNKRLEKINVEYQNTY